MKLTKKTQLNVITNQVVQFGIVINVDLFKNLQAIISQVCAIDQIDLTVAMAKASGLKCRAIE